MARILLIDDDDMVRSTLHYILVKSGHTVIEAHNGVEGLELYPSVSADLLITDIVMPDMNGLQFLQKLHHNYPPVRTIAISGGGAHFNDNCLQAAKSLGVEKVLAKPFSCAAFMTAVNDLLAATDLKSRVSSP